MNRYFVSDKLHKNLRKISKKDKIFYDKILSKISEIINSENIEHYKNLKYKFKDSKRVHIAHFVLIFRYDKKSNTIIFDNIKHHDLVYKEK
jgi:mRNA-degrading endonuclease RelE of RelBE toxin-antitoxin system